MQEQVITLSTSVGKQDVTYTEVLKVMWHPTENTTQVSKLRVQIKSDSYDFQSHARIELWDGSKWNNVHSIHFGEMETAPKLCYAQLGTNASNFKLDRDELVRVAKQILN